MYKRTDPKRTCVENHIKKLLSPVHNIFGSERKVTFKLFILYTLKKSPNRTQNMH